MRLISHDRLRRIVGLSKRLDELSDAKRELLRQMVDLTAQTDAVRVERNALQNLDAPIAELPNEVLAMIFEEGMHPPGTSKSDHFGILVSHVTHPWRTVAVGTRKLWNTIWCIPPRNTSNMAKCIDRASTFLSRAKSLPLAISLESFRDIHLSAKFLQLVSDHIGHCRQLRIVDTQHRGLTMVLKHISSQPMPLLASIDLGCYAKDILEFKEQLFPSGGYRLATARIVNVKMRTMHFCLPAFESLTALQLADVYISHRNDVEYDLFRDALMALPSLRHLELWVYNFDKKLFPSPRLPILLPELQHLMVDGRHASDPFDTLCCIQAASLVALSLSRWNNSKSLTLDADTFDFPSLQHLLVTSVVGAVPDFVVFARNFARKFPTIEQLTFAPGRDATHSSLHNIDRILYAILCGADDDDRAGTNAHIGLLWPKLQSFAFSTSRGGFDGPKLHSTILKLQAAGHPIRKLLLAGRRHPAGVESRETIEIEEFYFDWPTPFDCTVRFVQEEITF